MESNILECMRTKSRSVPACSLTPKITKLVIVAYLRIRHVVHKRRRSARVDDEFCQLRVANVANQPEKRAAEGTGEA